MSTDFRALCAELIASWDADGCDWKPQHQARWEATVNRARAALAEPECREPAAVTGQPSDEEVAELVAALRNDAINCTCSTLTSADLRRAAELLERLSPPQPVPVSERPPGPKDCDAEGRCWWGTPSFVNCYSVTQSAQWRLSAPDDRFGSELFCLPAHALPLPEVGE